MEPAKDRPDDGGGQRRGAVHRLAAMEPAEDQPDDPWSRMIPVWTAEPQWSWPSLSRMTVIVPVAPTGLDVPQWSRPGTGRMTW